MTDVRKEEQRYRKAVEEMVKDHNRTDRMRDIERAFGGKNLRRVLQDLHEKTDGNRSEMVRRINAQLDGDEKFSRQTLYDWLDKYNIS